MTVDVSVGIVRVSVVVSGGVRVVMEMSVTLVVVRVRVGDCGWSGWGECGCGGGCECHSGGTHTLWLG